MRAKKEKRNFWLSSEVDCMLNLIKEIQTAQGTTSTTHYTFVQIANKMRTFGFPNKSPTQIRRKWFQMKSAYLCFRRGNKDRLLLIPEKFRGDIAQFVEAEYKGSKQEHVEISDTTLKTISNTKSSTLPGSKWAKCQANSIGPNLRKKVKPEKAVKLDKSYIYQQKFFKYTTRLKVLLKSLCEDFTQRQRALMEYEHGLQENRDAFIIDSFKKTVYIILSSSPYINKDSY